MSMEWPIGKDLQRHRHELGNRTCCEKWTEPVSATSLHHYEGGRSSKHNFRISFNATYIIVNSTKNSFRVSAVATSPTAQRPDWAVGRLTRWHTELHRKLAASGSFGHILLVQPTLHSQINRRREVERERKCLGQYNVAQQPFQKPRQYHQNQWYSHWKIRRPRGT
jgi:hypothetical protein